MIISVPSPATIIAICVLSTLAILVAYISFVLTRDEDDDQDFLLIMLLIVVSVIIVCLVLILGAYLFAQR